jgi:hypothetical protein
MVRYYIYKEKSKHTNPLQNTWYKPDYNYYVYVLQLSDMYYLQVLGR